MPSVNFKELQDDATSFQQLGPPGTAPASTGKRSEPLHLPAVSPAGGRGLLSDPKGLSSRTPRRVDAGFVTPTPPEETTHQQQRRWERDRAPQHPLPLQRLGDLDPRSPDRRDLREDPRSPTAAYSGRGPRHDRVMTAPTSDTVCLPQMDPEVVSKWQASMGDPKSRAQFIKMLLKVRVLVDTSELLRSSICQAMLPMEYAADEVVFRQGDEADWMALCLRGRLVCEIEGAMKGNVKPGGVVGDVFAYDVKPGGVVGDVNLLGISKRRTVTVKAAAQSTMLVLSRKSFESAVRQHGNFPLLDEAYQMQNLRADPESFCTFRCFKRFDREFVAALCEHLEPRLCYPQDVLMREKNYGNEMYILQAGFVKVEQNGNLIVTLGGGNVLGELAVLGTDKRRTATVTCTCLCLVYVLNGDVFHEVLQCFPEARKIFDHSYIARLVTFGLPKVKEELNNLDKFYGSAHPCANTELLMT